MKILFYLTLISILHIPCTKTMLKKDYELNIDHENRDSEYNQKKLSKKKSYLSKRPNNTYNPIPSDNNEPLDARHVLNEFWKSLAGYPTAYINDEFKKAAMYYGGDPNYTIRRYQIAAAVLTGADPNIEIDEFSHMTPLYDAALHQDYSLCEFLLTHKADPNNQTTGEPPFFLAKKVALAQLFLKHGADPSLKCPNYPQNSIFYKVMQPEYEEGLIRLYKQNGASVFMTNFDGVNAAHALTGCATAFVFLAGPRHPDIMLEKAKILLDGLDSEQAKKLLTARTCFDRTPIDYIANEPQFKALYVYLKNKVSQENEALKFFEAKNS